jgi:hypothetical protein
MKLSLPLYQVEDCARILHGHGDFSTANSRGNFLRQMEELAEVLAPAIIRQYELEKNNPSARTNLLDKIFGRE